jgi:hypothetical protein
MDIAEIRYRNYKALLKRFEEEQMAEGLPERGSLNRFGEKTGVSPRYLSHVNARRKNLGDSSARMFEGAFSLPHGWMDVDHSAGIDPADKREREYLALALSLYRRNALVAQAEIIKIAHGLLDGDSGLPKK